MPPCCSTGSSEARKPGGVVGRLSEELPALGHMLSLVPPLHSASRNLWSILFVELTTIGSEYSSSVVCLVPLCTCQYRDCIFYSQDGMSRWVNDS